MKTSSKTYLGLISTAMILAGCAQMGIGSKKGDIFCPKGAILKGAERTLKEGITVDMSYAQTACVQEGDDIVAAVKLEFTYSQMDDEDKTIRMPIFVVRVDAQDQVLDRRVLGLEIPIEGRKGRTFEVVEDFVMSNSPENQNITLMSGFLNPVGDPTQ